MNVSFSQQLHNQFNGYALYEDAHLLEMIIDPRSKRKQDRRKNNRVQAKRRLREKRYGKISGGPMKKMIVCEHPKKMIIMHPTLMEKVKKEINERYERKVEEAFIGKPGRPFMDYPY